VKENHSKKILVIAVAAGLALIMVMTSFMGCSSTPVTSTAVTTATQTAVKTTTATATTTTTQTSTVQAKNTKIIWSCHDVKGGSWSEIYDPFFAAVTKRTNGTIIFEQHWGGELSGFFEAYDNTANGTVDMAQTMCSMYSNLFPLEDITSIVNYEVHDLAVTQTVNELASKYPAMAQAYEKSGTKLLWRVCTFPNMSAMGKGKAIRSFADFKGKKYLSTGKWDSEMWSSLGMTGVSMMPTETFLNLQTGVVDGATLTLASLFDFGWGEVTPFITDTNVRCGSFQAVMNLNKWNGLSPDQQKIIQEEAAKIAVAQDQQQLRFDRDLRATATKKWGTEFIKLTADDFAKMNTATAPVQTKFKTEFDGKGLPGTAILTDWLNLAKKYSGSEYALK
jgi:TRAP-type transport system periplasmic protein